MNLLALFFMVACGLQTAAAATIGHEIGSQNIQKAKEYFKVTQIISGIAITITVMIFALFSKWFYRLFTEDEKTLEICNEVYILVCLGMFPDMWQGYMQGVIKALGIQHKVMWLNLIAYWVINLPLSLLLTFHLEWGFSGLWWSIIFAQMFMMFSITIMAKSANWKTACEQAYQR